MARKPHATIRQPGFALVEVVQIDTAGGESVLMTALVSRVPCRDEEVELPDGTRQKVTKVRHQIHLSGSPPKDGAVDAWVYYDAPSPPIVSTRDRILSTSRPA